MTDHRYIVLMAGGFGTRLYPRSRESLPKQFQKIVDGKTLLQDNFDLLKKVLPPEKIYVSTNINFIKEVQKELPDLPAKNIIGELERKNTAPALALATKTIYEIDPQATILNSQADSLVTKPQNFIPAAKIAFETIEKHPEKILIIASLPLYPHTGYGYIERDGVFIKNGKTDIFNVIKFHEKPGRETAIHFIKSGNFYWNGGGFFTWQAKNFLAWFKKTTNCKEIVFQNLPSEPIEPSFLEKMDNIVTFPADLGWSDIGSWDVVAEMIDEFQKDDHGNYADCENVLVNTHNTIISSHDPKMLVATLGLDNIQVITTPDAILIMERGRGQDVKKIVEKLKEKKLDKYL